MARFLIVEARFYAHLNDMLIAGARDALEAAGHEAEVLAVIQKEAKRRRDTAAEYERLGAPDKAAAELAELPVLERYLPRQLSEAEVEVIVREVIAEKLRPLLDLPVDKRR